MSKVLSLLARPNYRGVTTDRLVYMLQEFNYKLQNFDPEIDIDFVKPSAHTEEEWVDDHKQFLFETIMGLEEELERRRKLRYSGVQSTNSEIIQTIKNAIKIDDVLALYTEVFIHKKVWTYRCTLHGKDVHPSGVIYPDEGRFHCFACGKHGDIFDAVQFFERVDLPKAIAKLARHIGLDTKPLIKRKRDLTDVTV